MDHDDNFALLLLTMIQTCYAFGILFIACEICQRVNLAFAECNDMINQFKWYLFPANCQRMLPFIICLAQQPVNIRCFGSAQCDRETFKCVSETEQIAYKLN